MYWRAGDINTARSILEEEAVYKLAWREALQAMLDGWSGAAAVPQAAQLSMAAVLERNEQLRTQVAAHFGSEAGEGWGPQHQHAAMVLGACARDRGRPPVKGT